MAPRPRHLAVALLVASAWLLARLSVGNFIELGGMSQHGRVALVTGANKGIGKEVARKLAGVCTFLGCRDNELGESAARELREGGCDVRSIQLDITDPASVLAARDRIVAEHGRLDILVNSAAICYNDPTLYGRCEFTHFTKQAAPTVNTNFFGTLSITRAVLPLLRAAPAPRIVNVVSYAGRLSILRSLERVEAFTSPTLTVKQVEDFMKEFVRDVEAGVHASRGWPSTCYGMSKLGLIALTKVLARDEPQVMVNSVDPGYCATDQNMHQGTRSAEHGARTPAFLALLPSSRFVSGKHFFDEAEVEW